MSDIEVIDRAANPNSDSEDEDRISFDELLSSRVGFGIYQIIVLMVVCLIDFIDGSEQYYMMILVQVLQTEWSLDNHQIEILGSFYYIGLFVGAIIAGIFCDWFGRKNTMVVGCFIQLSTVLWTSFASNFIHMVAIRTLYGIVIGMTLPIGILMVTELVPKHIRGRCIILTQSAYMLGKFYLLLLAYIFMDDLSKGNWRAIAVCQLFPTLVMTIGCIAFLDESPRFLVSHNRIDEAIVILNRIGHRNKSPNPFNPITPQEQEGLQRWQSAVFSQQPSTGMILKSLFKGQNLSVSWRLILANTVNSFISSGTLFLLPFYLHSTGQGLMELFIATLGEVPASIFVYFFIDVQSVGRLKIVNATLFLSAVVLIIIFIVGEPFLLGGLVCLKFFSRFTGLCSTPLISESYDTMHRSLGLGLSTAVGRAMGSISPFILYEVYLHDKWIVFLIFSILTLVVFLAFLSYPVDRTSKPLDQNQQETKPKSPPLDAARHTNEDTLGLLIAQKHDDDSSTVVSRAALQVL